MAFARSQFNAVVQHEGKTFVVNTRTQKILPAALAKRFVSGAVLSAIEERMLARDGFLVSDRLPEAKILEVLFQRRKFNPPQAGVTVAPTLKCNCACPDCVQTKLDRTTVMSRADLDATIAAVGTQFAERQPANGALLWLHGGEPFVAPDECAYLAEGARQATARQGLELKVGVATNCTLMHKKRQRKMLAAVDYIYAAMAQSRAGQARERPYIGGRNSYDDALEGLAAAAEAGKDIHLRINVRSPEEVPETIPRLLEDVKEALGGAERPLTFELAPLEPFCGACAVGTGCRTVSRPQGLALATADGMSQYRQLREAAERILDHLPWPRESFDRLVEEPWLKPPMTDETDLPLCSYQRGANVYIGPTGHIYTCAPLAHMPEARVGHVRRGLLRNSAYLAFLCADPFGDPECLACALLPLCLGGCGALPARRVRFSTATCKQEQLELLQGYVATWGRDGRGPDVSRLSAVPTKQRKERPPLLQMR